MHVYIKPIAKHFRQNANAENAAGAKAYMRNQFDYFGIKAATRQSISKDYMKEVLPAFTELNIIVKELWQLPEREYQYFAIDLMAAMRKQWTKDITDLIEFILINKSWWDTVDHAASDLTGPYFKLFPQQINKITGNWNRSENFWLQRSSIMFQKKYKKETDTVLLSKYILRHTQSKAFFIQKAIGWDLREYSKTDAAWVKNFVTQNKLAPLSKREALKRIG
ncbi:MAG: DNA alkylation repair protein [Ferruginibacter sp.]